MKTAKLTGDALTVVDLIEELKSYDEDTKVVIAYPSGDYWGNTVAVPVTGICEEQVEYSDQHRQLKVLSVDDDGDCEPEEVIVLGLY